MKITDDQLMKAFAGANYGGDEGDANKRRRIVAVAMFKKMVGWSNGSTTSFICERLGLLDSNMDTTYEGRQWAYRYFVDSEMNKEIGELLKRDIEINKQLIELLRRGNK